VARCCESIGPDQCDVLEPFIRVRLRDVRVIAYGLIDDAPELGTVPTGTCLLRHRGPIALVSVLVRAGGFAPEGVAIAVPVRERHCPALEQVLIIQVGSVAVPSMSFTHTCLMGISESTTTRTLSMVQFSKACLMKYLIRS